MPSKLSLLLSALAVTSVQAYDNGVYGLGYWNKSYAIEANTHPNASTSVPFTLGSKTFTFQVNIAEFVPTDYDYLPNPRQAAAFYNLLWEGGGSLNQSVKEALGGGLGEGVPRVCLTVPLGPMTRDATNGYREEDNGDCSHAFGKQCMQDLEKVDPSSLTGSTVTCDLSWMPKSCKERFGDGGLGGTALVTPSILPNDTRALMQFKSSPVEISYYSSQVFSAGNSSYYEREDERLHAIFLSGSWGVTPVCNRVNSTKVKKGNGAVYEGGAGKLKGSWGLVVGMAVAVGMGMSVL